MTEQIIRFRRDGRESWGVVEEGGDLILELAGPPFDGIRPSGDRLPLSEAELLAPCRPGKILALGLNYMEHIREMGHQAPEEPVLFMKPATAVIGPGDPIVLPTGVGRVDYEAELAMVIGRRSRNLTAETAPGAVLGLTCFNDVTARDLQKKDGQWTRAKSFDTFAPLGPWIVTGPLEEDRSVECLVNGELRQEGSTDDLLFPLKDILIFVSGIMTLEPGDVIATGTPRGVGPLSAGDEVQVRISGIGVLTNRVVEDEQSKEP